MGPTSLRVNMHVSFEDTDLVLALRTAGKGKKLASRIKELMRLGLLAETLRAHWRIEWLAQQQTTAQPLANGSSPIDALASDENDGLSLGDDVFAEVVN